MFKNTKITTKVLLLGAFLLVVSTVLIAMLFFTMRNLSIQKAEQEVSKEALNAAEVFNKDFREVSAKVVSYADRIRFHMVKSPASRQC